MTEHQTSLTPARPGLVRRLQGYVGSLLAIEAGGSAREQTQDALLKRLVLLYVLVQLVGALWDLPGDHGWENDGIAPRGVFSGLSGNLKPGNAHRYPLFHYVLSLIASLPALLLTPLAAGSLGKTALLEAGAGTLVMTGVSLCVKLLGIGLSALALLALAAFTRRSASVEASRCAAAFCALNLSFAYYGRASNLDGPYLAWSALLLERLSLLGQGDARAQAARYVQMGLLGAAAVATKDQAYAVVFPLFAVAGVHALMARSLPRLVRLALSAGAGYAVFSGALFNPRGFAARITMLRGTNSQDWKIYEDTSLGLWTNVGDLAGNVPMWWWPWPVLVLAGLGLCVCLVWGTRDRKLLPLLPLVMGLGGLCLFTLVVRRNDHRFVLPAAFVASYYAGVGASALLRASSGRARRATQVGLGLLFAAAGFQNLLLLVTQFSDGRRQVAAFLAERPRGTRVETYGLPVYQPHYWLGSDAPYQVTRLQPLSGEPWAPIRGLTNVRDSYANLSARGPDILLIPEGFAMRYFERTLRPGERLSEQERKAQLDRDATEFMRAAVANELPGYELLFVAGEDLPAPLARLGLSPVSVHGSTGMRYWVLSKKG
ncbi:MAG: hypothetical protein QM778_25300 [Myxococcales bacterium]